MVRGPGSGQTDEEHKKYKAASSRSGVEEEEGPGLKGRVTAGRSSWSCAGLKSGIVKHESGKTSLFQSRVNC